MGSDSDLHDNGVLELRLYGDNVESCSDPGETRENCESDFVRTNQRVREAARAAKEWAEADRIRDELAEQGVEVQDTPDGVRWRRV